MTTDADKLRAARAIEFTQYVMPHGRKRKTHIERPEEIANKAQDIIEAGYRFECEILSDYKTVSLTIADDDDDHAIEVVPNGPGVPKAVDRLIENFHTKLAEEQEQ